MAGGGAPKVQRRNKSLSSPCTSWPPSDNICASTTPMYPLCPVSKTRIDFFSSRLSKALHPIPIASEGFASRATYPCTARTIRVETPSTDRLAQEAPKALFQTESYRPQYSQVPSAQERRMLR